MSENTEPEYGRRRKEIVDALGLPPSYAEIAPGDELEPEEDSSSFAALPPFITVKKGLRRAFDTLKNKVIVKERLDDLRDRAPIAVSVLLGAVAAASLVAAGADKFIGDEKLNPIKGQTSDDTEQPPHAPSARITETEFANILISDELIKASSDK
jgi:hypothetical protein